MSRPKGLRYEWRTGQAAARRDLNGSFRPVSRSSAARSSGGGASIGLASIEAINESGYGAIGTPDDAIAVLEKFWAKTGGFGGIMMLAHDWADWEATKRSYELFARYVLPKFNGANDSRNESMEWMRANREDFSTQNRAATKKTIDTHFAADAAKGRAAE